MTPGIGLARYAVRSQRRPFLAMVALLALAGLLEGLGVATLLPVGLVLAPAGPVPLVVSIASRWTAGPPSSPDWR